MNKIFQTLALCVAAFVVATSFKAPVQVAPVTPLIFEREQVRIESPPEPALQQQKEALASAAEKNPLLGKVMVPHPPITYDVEIRPEDALRLDYIHSLNELNDSTGVMIAFTAPSMVPLPVMQTPTPVDALFIAKDGTVLQIYPNVVLSELRQDVMAPSPIKAFLFLRAGSALARGIHPKDVVASKKFLAAPPLLQ